MSCYKITADLRSGICVSDPWSPSIDSILAFFQLKNEIGTAEFNISSAMGEQTTCENLPVNKTFYKDLWWYQCSSPEYEYKHEIKRQYYKKFNIDYALLIEKKVKKIELTKNQFKNYSLFFMQAIVSKISWHLICDIEKVMKLLNECSQIGAKRGKGMGEVINWSYEKGDPEKAIHSRALPENYAKDNGIIGTLMTRGFRPSFRIPKNRTICVMN